MRKPRRGADRSLDGVGSLLRELLALDDHLDVVLVFSPRLVVAPPHRPLVLALQPQVLACRAQGRTLVALLPSQSAGVAALKEGPTPSVNGSQA